MWTFDDKTLVVRGGTSCKFISIVTTQTMFNWEGQKYENNLDPVLLQHDRCWRYTGMYHEWWTLQNFSQYHRSEYGKAGK